ncbi:hypothetical protein [Streptomyces sp. SP18CS02]|uniref:hypothetical protein n=1 Tax=Streptomyces sp. SP18CS02 TaxID=3002531 RepID=UPI002E771FF1|nr:hypothetical protein [Streptomyces sp. SP18CS02]MEE1752111.1 hypothetical protein [Streptomyces sp. SP18CS02]
MPKKSKPSEPSHGEGPSRHRGTEQHGWAPDVDETRQQDNPSAHRSFHPDEYAPGRGRGRTSAKEERKPVPGDAVKSDTTRGEEYSEKSEEGMRDTGRKGRSRRPGGTKDASAFTGVDPQDPPHGRRSG